MVFVLALEAMGARPWRRPFRTRTKSDRLLKVGKKPCIQRTYSANLRVRRRIRTTSRAGVPGAAERCGRALPAEGQACLLEEGVGRCGAVRGAGASQSARWLRADRALRHGPLARHGSRCWASGRQLGRRRILGRLAGGRRGAAWPLMHSAPAGRRPTRRCLASEWQTHMKALVANTASLTRNAG